MKKLLWVDLEMTGLDESQHHIIEAAAMITNYELEILDQYHSVVYQPPEVIAKMDDWCKKTHGESGLTKQIPVGKQLKEVEEDLLKLLDRHFPKEQRVVLAGNSIWNDRRFIDRYMPLFAGRLHYRLVDVSSFKEVFRERYGVKLNKTNQHRAVDDIRESIAELKTYLAYVQIPAPEPKSPPPSK